MKENNDLPIYEMTVEPPPDTIVIGSVLGDLSCHIITTGRSAIKLPRWKWWSRAHIKADWDRYRRAVEFKRREKHWDWVSERRDAK